MFTMNYSKRYYYMNNETGELLTYKQMVKQAREEYDLDDPTCILDLDEYYSLTTCEII